MQVPILIVGAGPTGLSSSILLSRFGIRSLVVERHASTSIHPKATARILGFSVDDRLALVASLDDDRRCA